MSKIVQKENRSSEVASEYRNFELVPGSMKAPGLNTSMFCTLTSSGFFRYSTTIVRIDEISPVRLA